MQVDQEDQKAQSGDTDEKKSEAEEMEVLFCFLIDKVLKLFTAEMTMQHGVLCNLENR